LPVNCEPGRYGLASQLFENPFVPTSANEDSSLGLEFSEEGFEDFSKLLIKRRARYGGKAVLKKHA
jgi:hypothetical protein